MTFLLKLEMTIDNWLRGITINYLPPNPWVVNEMKDLAHPQFSLMIEEESSARTQRDGSSKL